MSVSQIKYANELEFELNALSSSIEGVSLIEEKNENAKLIHANNVANNFLILRNKMLAKKQADVYFELVNETIELLKIYADMQKKLADDILPFSDLPINEDERALFVEYNVQYKQYLHTAKTDIFTILQSKDLFAQAENISNLKATFNNIQEFHRNPATFKMETLINSMEKTKSKASSYIGIALAVASTITAFLGAFMIMLPMLAVLVLPMVYLTYNLYNEYQANKPENKYALPKNINSELVGLRTVGYGVAGFFRQKTREKAANVPVMERQAELVQANNSYSPQSA